MRLSSFILEHQESILQEWEDFARTLEPASLAMDSPALRDHAAFILDTLRADLDTDRTARQQFAKSGVPASRSPVGSYAESHAAGRLRSGYTIVQLVAEYRALRASVLTRWAAQGAAISASDADDITRFNEAIDQALAESVAEFSRLSTSAVEEEKRRLRAILEAAPVGIFIADVNGKMVASNPESSRIWGPHPVPQQIEGYTDWKGWWADGSQRHGQKLGPRDWPVIRALAGEEAPRDVVEIEPFDAPDTRKTLVLTAAPLRDDKQAIVGSLVAQMDITAQVDAEAALRESEAKFRTIANAMPQMVWSTLPDGHHDYYNQRWYDFTGVPEGSTDGEGWNGMFHPDDQARAWKVWRFSLATGADYEIQYRLRHRSGEYRWTLGRALPVRDESGKIIRWMGTCTDIHDQKLAEENLREVDRRKDEFLAMLAHELRNPLAPIGTAAELLLADGVDEATLRETSGIITRQVTHMTNLVDDLLDVSRVTRGLVTLNTEAVDLKAVLHSAIEQARSLIDARRHALTLRITAAAAPVEADRTRLIQVVANLLTNAAKFTPPGGEIAVSLEVTDGQAGIRVQDSGIGIEPQFLPRIYDLFTQGDRSPERAQGGLGLGLALVRSLMELHGGTVQASSPGAGLGSSFTVLLPLAKAAVLAPQRPSGTAPPGAAAASPGQRIMLVDDNVDAAVMLAALLRMSGHQVAVKHDGLSALETSDGPQPEVFILDIGLPGLDGYELARCLRRRPARAQAPLTLIALTGYGKSQDRELSKAAGFDHHFVKPVDLAALRAVLARPR